jgi:hypothetical protein
MPVELLLEIMNLRTFSGRVITSALTTKSPEFLDTL